ncbi:MAG: segregation/condensation protein A [Lachnospiraceae bacterium]|nr:segregation/condensation protein A [Lachnospiraceae bacterium]
MGIPVKLQEFEGPLDLLLHLIDKNKISIFDIPITEITNQYLEYIRSMKEQDMNVASEFMVMAAELLDIKCRMLLPKDPEKEEEEDPREELVRRLLEYKTYKYMSYELRDRMEEENSIFREAAIPKEVLSWRPKAEPEELLGDTTLDVLHAIFKEVLRRQKDKIDPVGSEFREVKADQVNIDDKVRELAGYAKTHRSFSFRNLMKKQKTKLQTIVMFLAVLEFMKAGYITVRQDHLFDDMEIEAVEGTDFDNIDSNGELMDEYKADGSGN